MTPAGLRRELQDLSAQRDRLEVQRATLAQALEHALGSDRYDTNIVGGIRHDLAQTMLRLRDIDDRHGLLAEKLPSPAQVLAATKRAVELQRAISEARDTFDAAAGAFVASLELAEGAGRRLVQVRERGRVVVAEVIQLADDVGLTVERPKVPGLPPAVEQVCHLQSVLLGECVFGEPDDVTLNNLAAARVVANGPVGVG
jgi:hypothetical protein